MDDWKAAIAKMLVERMDVDPDLAAEPSTHLVDDLGFGDIEFLEITGHLEKLAGRPIPAGMRHRIWTSPKVGWLVQYGAQLAPNGPRDLPDPAVNVTRGG